MELNYTPRDIKEIEDVAKTPITEAIADLSMDNLTLFVRKGLKVSEEEALDKIDEYLNEGNDTMALYMLIIKKLEDRGFLPRKMKIYHQLETKLTQLYEEQE